MRKLLVPACLALSCVGWLSGCGIPRTTCSNSCPPRHANSRGMLAQKWTVSDSHPGESVRPAANSGHQSAPRSSPVKNDDQLMILNMTSKEIAPVQSTQPTQASNVPALPKVIDEVALVQRMPEGPPGNERTAPESSDGPLIINSDGKVTPPPAPPLPTLVTAPASAPMIEPFEAPKVVVADASKPMDTTVMEHAPAKPAVNSESGKSLTGQVQEWRKTWRLRYADVDQVDAHGGSVQLEGGPELAKLRDGQRVRVRGAIIPAADRLGTARYRVDSIEFLD